MKPLKYLPLEESQPQTAKQKSAKPIPDYSKWFRKNDAHPYVGYAAYVWRIVILGGMIIIIAPLFTNEPQIAEAGWTYTALGAFSVFFTLFPQFVITGRGLIRLIGKIIKPFSYVNALGLSYLVRFPEFQANSEDYSKNEYFDNAKAAELFPIALRFQSLFQTNVPLVNNVKTAQERIALRGDLTKLIRLFQEAAQKWQSANNNNTGVSLIELMHLYDDAAVYAEQQRALLDAYKPPVTETEQFFFENINGGRGEIVRDEFDRVMSFSFIAAPGVYYLGYESERGVKTQLKDMIFKVKEWQLVDFTPLELPIFGGCLYIGSEQQQSLEKVPFIKRPIF